MCSWNSQNCLYATWEICIAFTNMNGIQKWKIKREVSKNHTSYCLKLHSNSIHVVKHELILITESSTAAVFIWLQLYWQKGCVLFGTTTILQQVEIINIFLQSTPNSSSLPLEICWFTLVPRKPSSFSVNYSYLGNIWQRTNYYALLLHFLHFTCQSVKRTDNVKVIKRHLKIL